MALLDQVSKLNPSTPGERLRVRVGIETGPVVVGEIIGKESAQEHAVVGKTANLAARLQALAEPDTIVVGPVTYRLAASGATFHALGKHDLKGFDAPIPAWSVDAIRGTADRLHTDRTSAVTPLVGRALASAFARMRSGEALFVHLVGEPGIGKSRLAREFLDQNRELAAILVGHCASQGGSTAFFPFINLLRTWFGDTDSTRSDTTRSTGDDWMTRLVGSGLDAQRHAPYILKLLDISHPTVSQIEPDLIGVRTQEALLRFVVEHGRVRPTILFINDLHWIDERSATLLDMLARSEARQGVLVLTTLRRRYTPPWRGISGVEEITLAPLSASESISLFQYRIADALAGSDLEDIVERAGGNPLFLEELARHVALATGLAGEDWGATVPETLAGLLMQRVDALSPRARRVVETAAVAGRRFGAALLGQGKEDELKELEAGGVLLPELGAANIYRFHHALVHEVVYESLLEADRRRLHGEVGARLKALYAGHEIEVAEDLARHHEAANDARLAAQYAYLAGNKALDLFALSDAENWYGKALSLAPFEGDTQDDLLFARAVVNQTQVLCWNGDFPAMVGLAKTHLPRIRELGEIEEVSRALTWIGEGYMHVGRYEDARETLRQALDGGRAIGNDSCIGYASGELMWLDSIVGEGPDFDSLPDRAAELEALADSVGDRYLVTLAHYARWARATQIGKVGDALEIARKMRAHGEQSDYPPAVCWGACLEADGHAKAGNAIDAERAAQAGREAAACRFDVLMAELSLGMALVTLGQIDEGLPLLSKAPWRTDRIGALYFAYAGDVAYGKALAASGQFNEGLNWLRDGIDWFQSIGNHRAANMAALELARILIEHVGQPVARRGLRQRLRWMFSGATDPTDEARTCLDQVLAQSHELSMFSARAEALVLRAHLAELEDDITTARAALGEAQGLTVSLGWLPLDQRVNSEIRRLDQASDS
jgi:tetratricopeptide (TPR) repeat protein